MDFDHWETISLPIYAQRPIHLTLANNLDPDQTQHLFWVLFALCTGISIKHGNN